MIKNIIGAVVILYAFAFVVQIVSCKPLPTPQETREAREAYQKMRDAGFTPEQINRYTKGD